MNKVFLVTILAFVGAVSFLFISKSSTETSTTTKNVDINDSIKEQSTPVDIKASFTIITNTTLRLFSDLKYHNRSTEVYITSDNPAIIIVKKSGTTWADFFDTLPMKITKECLNTGTGQEFCTNENKVLKFFVNGSLDQNALDKEIKNGDKLLVEYTDK